MSDQLIKELIECDCSKVDKFSFDNLSVYAKVCKVYDTDSITIIFKYNHKMVKLNVRLDGIDAPELYSKIKCESQMCKKGTASLSELINGKVVKVDLGKFDKFGRTLARIYTLEPIIEDMYCINDWLIRFQYARKYDGGKKEIWTQQELDSAGLDITKF